MRPLSASSETHTVRLSADGVKASVTYELQDGNLRPGDRKTVVITMTSADISRRAQLKLTPIGLRISRINTKAVETTAKSWTSGPIELPPGPTKTFNFELSLTAEGPVAGTRVRNRLVAKLINLGASDRSSSSDQTQISWPVQDCSRVYLANLRVLSKRTKDEMSALPALLIDRNPSFSGRWLIAPPVTKIEKTFETRNELKNVCARSKRVRVRVNGRRRWRTQCLEQKQVEKPVKVALPVDPALKKRADDEKSLVAYLSDYVNERGRGLEFSKRRGRYYWLVRRLPGDLQNYMNQPRNEAICTGAPLLIKYYRSNTAALLRRIQKVYDMRDLSIRLARRRVKEAGGSVIAADRTSRELLTTLNRHILPETARLDFEKGAPVIKQLAETKKIIEATEKSQASRVDTPINALAKAALGAIEASVYAEFVAQRYKKIELTMFNSMDKISKLHKSICQCNESR